MRFSADFGPKFFKKIRGHKILRPGSREITPKSVPPDDAKPLREPQTSPNIVPSVGTLRRVRFRVILSGFRTENFEKFSRPPQNFASGIARDRAKLRAARQRHASPRAREVPKHCAERRHAAAREIPCDSQRIPDRKFRKIFAAAKFCVRNRARSRRNPRCPTTPSLAARHEGPQTLCRASAWCGA